MIKFGAFLLHFQRATEKVIILPEFLILRYYQSTWSVNVWPGTKYWWLIITTEKRYIGPKDWKEREKAKIRSIEMMN